MSTPPTPQRPEPVQRMLDALFAVETGTRELIALATEAMTAYHEEGGLPQQPIAFAWGRVPDPEPDRAKRAKVMADRAAMWNRIGPAHAEWSRRQDRLFFAVQDWRAALDTARGLIPAAAPWTDRRDLPAVERWSARFRDEISRLGGVVHRIMIGDLPYLEHRTVLGLQTGLEEMERRTAELSSIGPEALPDTRPEPPGPVCPDLDHFLHNLWVSHEMLQQVVRRRSREELPPTPAMLAELNERGRLVHMGQSPREEAVHRFLTEVRPVLEQWRERALLEARNRAGGAAGEIVSLLLKAMAAVDALAEAAAEADTVWAAPWDRAQVEHHRVAESLQTLRPLVAAPPAPPSEAGSRAPQLAAPLLDQLRRLQERFQSCYAGGGRLTLLVARRWPIPSEDRRPSTWRDHPGGAGSFRTALYTGQFDDAGTGSRADFRDLAVQACRLLRSVPGLAGLGPLGRWLSQQPGGSDADWAVAVAEAAADGGCGPVAAQRRVLIADPATGWPVELLWGADELEQALAEHPGWRPAVEAMALPADAYVIDPVGDAFVASAEAIAQITAVVASAPASSGSGELGSTGPPAAPAIASEEPAAAAVGADDPDFHRVVVDRGTFSVRWRGLTCPLGNVKPFDLIEILARRPGQYFNVQDLYEEVWGGEKRVKSALPQAIWRLRQELKGAGMERLRIDGSKREHYALIVP